MKAALWHETSIATNMTLTRRNWGKKNKLGQIYKPEVREVNALCG